MTRLQPGSAGCSAIEGYNECETIYESRTSIVFRGRRAADGQTVVLKMLKGAYPGVRELARYRHEYDLLRSLDLDHVIVADRLQEYGSTLILVVEDFGAESLKKLAGQHCFTLEELLEIFITVCGALARLHERHILHKDINPSNIVYNPATRLCKLIDFGLAARLSPTHPSQDHANTLEGTLAYISPEQTGRMNRSVDYRSDLYSLGVSLYELLAGRLPFQAEHSLEMVHAHIAITATPVHEVNPAVPLPLSAIVARLMAKTAEQRYQSASGLGADLAACLDALRAAGRIDPFELGLHDQIGTFYLPQHLYGREQEIAHLLKTFNEQVAGQGAMRFVLLSGYSGAGKTSLVKEIYKPVTGSNGYFIKGKFDQHQRTIPYYALKQALAELADVWLTESEERLAAIAAALREALGEAGGVMVDLIPALELIIGPQPQAPELAGMEAQNRFNYVCRSFFRCVAAADHPLALFIDDLQWSDLASLNLLSALLTDSQITSFLLIGAYRDNETSPSHPLMLMLESLSRKGIVPDTIQVGNLSEQDVAALCADTFHVAPLAVARLARLIHIKTLGNPFFVTQFIKTLHADRLITFDAGRRHWCWDIDEIEQHPIPDDVVQLMAAKITTLAPATQRLLTLAACIGHVFALDTLTMIGKGEECETRADLASAVREGLVIPDAHLYRFSHDRIQQAAYSLMADSERTHLRIGRLLLRDGKPAGERLFEVVNQLNAARRLITDPQERLELAALNQEAGQQAKGGTAYAAALNYLSSAVELLPADQWSRHYDLTFSIHSEWAWCRFYAGETAGIEALFATLLAHAQGLEDAVRVHTIRMEYYHLAGDYGRAVEIQKEALRLLGVEIDGEGISALLERELDAVPRLLGGRRIESLCDAPLMDSPRHAAIMDILMGLWTSAYLDSQLELVAWSSCKMTNISLEYGNNRLTAYGYMNYAFVCVALLGQYETGHRFGEVANRLAERFDDLLLRGKVYLLFAVFVNHWRAPLATSLDYSRKSFPLLAGSGDWIYAGYCAEFAISDPTIWGMPCNELLEAAQRYIPFLQNNAPVVLDEFFRPACLNPLLQLLGRTRSDHTFDDDDFCEETFLQSYRNNPLALSYFYTAKLRSLYWFGDWDEALAMAGQADFVASVALAQAKVPEIYFFASLTLLALFDRFTPEEWEQHAICIAGYQEKMKVWAGHSPANFRHKFLLVEAERARIATSGWEALRLYEEAIDEAHKAGYLNNEALAYECAARFFLARNLTRLAANYLSEARYAYRKWGATAKVRQLERCYTEWSIIVPFDTRLGQSSTSSLTTSHATIEYDTSTDALDIVSIVQSSQSLASEIDLERLLGRMMKIVIKNAGADRAVLLDLHEGIWNIKAEARNRWETVSIPQAMTETVREASLPLSLINYCARKQESVVLSNAGAHGGFVKDPYFAATAMRSVLALPLLRSGTLKGVLYLENSLVEEAFTRERLTVLELLSSQMAISIENAEFYRELEQLVEQRTLALVRTNDELQQVNRQLEELSHTDGLTQIANRRAFDSFIEIEWRRHNRIQQDFSLILCDIDYFKQFNDTYGHIEGDHCLQRIAQAIKAAAQRSGDLVARYGGEEFVVVLPQTNRAGICKVIETIRHNVAALRIPHAGSKVHDQVTLSLGALHRIPQNGESIEDALAAADGALYQAKSQGRNRAVIVQRIGEAQPSPA
ncbi:MAG TPA: diguanylate cyclase [Candidatus Competibacteraceae bacterium]|nr:diguanylate cyclase [Candidatus Competibacteraceae bacterium]